ncbi:MAG TPA: peptidoglycan DD-metalloendopeptidase family protein [Acidimicrobiales bacterium]|nr:peptidoglycan DD-metalloendopeptidase family protein [Acidimicrobiales bacterium]
MAVPVPASADPGPEYRRIQFPVAEAVSFGDDFGDPRSGGRTHEGNDLMGRKMQPLLAAVDSTIKLARIDTAGLAGNMLTLVDDEGWRYNYIHLNNDSPGTDDNLNLPELVFPAGIRAGVRVKAGQHLSFLGDSGNAESTAPHLHFEIRRPDGSPIDPWTSLRLAQGLPAGNRCGYGTNPAAKADPAGGAGYWVLGADGGVFTFGAARFHGSTGALKLNKPIVGMAAIPAGDGYWLVASDGGVFSFGAATFHGSTGAIRLNKPIVAMSSTPSGEGYWLVASDGGIFAFGDARFHGSTGAITLNKPIVAMAPTPAGAGYRLIANDGGVFAFGDALFAGSTPGLGVTTTIVSAATSPSGAGYRMLAADGAVFAFGDATLRGSLPGTGLCRWPGGVRILPTATGSGYWVQAGDGQVFTFGDAPWHGSLASAGVKPNAAIIDMAAMGRPPGG